MQIKLKLELDACIKKLADMYRDSQEVIEGIPRATELLDVGREGEKPSDLQVIAGAETQGRWVRLLSLLYDGKRLDVDKPIIYEREGRKIQCHPDVVAEDAVWEIKSVHPGRYLYARVRPFGRDIEQLMLYLAATGKPVGYLVYESRADLDYTVHQIDHDPVKIQEIIDKLPLSGYNASGGDDSEAPRGQGQDEGYSRREEEAYGGA